MAPTGARARFLSENTWRLFLFFSFFFRRFITATIDWPQFGNLCNKNLKKKPPKYHVISFGIYVARTRLTCKTNARSLRISKFNAISVGHTFDISRRQIYAVSKEYQLMTLADATVANVKRISERRQEGWLLIDTPAPNGKRNKGTAASAMKLINDRFQMVSHKTAPIKLGTRSKWRAVLYVPMRWKMKETRLR